jgi:hypothetical protein
MLSEAEQAALACCERLTAYDLSGSRPLHAALAEHFAQKQAAEIAATVDQDESLDAAERGRAVPVAE